MSEKLRCYTLFDITNTGVINRSRPPVDTDQKLWLKNRNSQCNFDTVLQAISLRSQPEVINLPIKIIVNTIELNKFGSDITLNNCPCWFFDFEVQNISVFSDDISELGKLYTDCHEVPMIRQLDEINDLPAFLDTSKNRKNIHFEKL